MVYKSVLWAFGVLVAGTAQFALVGQMPLVLQARRRKAIVRTAPDNAQD